MGNVKCLLFSLGIPGLFGRHFLIYADQLNDNFGEKIYNIQINPVIVLLQTVGVFLRLVFIAPLQWTIAFCNFYFQRHGPKDIIKRLSATNIRAEQKESKKVEKAKALEAESAAKAKDKESEKPKEEKKDKPKEEKKDKEEKPKEDAQKDKEQKPKEEKPKDQVKEDDKKDEPLPTPLTVKPA